MTRTDAPRPSTSEADALLADAIERIWDEAQAVGLRPFPTHFEIVPSSIIYELGSYLMPGRFSHWTHGKMYQMQKTMYDYGLSKIYELVINTNPCWAFLLDSNTPIQNKLVVAHVLAHSDFFANNAYFARTSRRMLDTVTLNADRIRRYEYDHGHAEVERLLDAVLSIQEHVDPYGIDDPVDAAGAKTAPRTPGPYDDLWDPSDSSSSAADLPAVGPLRPKEPDRDLLRFVGNHSPILADWERDVVGIVRAEMLYFFPQMQTKIVNEGWATLLHATILHRLHLDADEYVDFADLHAGVTQPGQRRLNPYHVGYEILRTINRSHGGDDETIAPELFDLRETASDISLIRNELTKELVEDLDLYLYRRVGDELVITDKDWEAVRDRLVTDLTGYGFPIIAAVDGDHEGRRELLLRHEWTGKPLDLPYARHTLEHVHRLWGRTVWLETRSADETPLLLAYDAKHGHRPQP
ncbi:MAG: SpoVR family protein [Chloroflexota bacterium]|nr:SpoVR family protein [Chloroflexota bacterium]